MTAYSEPFGSTCNVYNEFWDQIVTLHSIAKGVCDAAQFQWRFSPTDADEGPWVPAGGHDSEPLLQDLAAWRTYHGDIWDALRWAMPPCDTKSPHWETRMENRAVQPMIAQPADFPKFWAWANLLQATGVCWRHRVKQICDTMVATECGVAELLDVSTTLSCNHVCLRVIGQASINA